MAKQQPLKSEKQTSTHKTTGMAFPLTPQKPIATKSPRNTIQNEITTPAGSIKTPSKGAWFGTKTIPRRHKKVSRDSIKGITKGDIRRLARRGGVKRMSVACYPDIRSALKDRLAETLYRIVPILEHRKQKTITAADVVFALRSMGRSIYGFD